MLFLKFSHTGIQHAVFVKLAIINGRGVFKEGAKWHLCFNRRERMTKSKKR